MTEPVQPRKVLIVDDSEIVLAVTSHALEAAGYRVVTHPHPAGCLALILKESPDLLLIDVNMPGLNGDTVVKMLGSTQSRSSMVILLHSTLPADVLTQKAEASGAHGFIRKTESSQELVRQVTRWLRAGGSSGTHLVGGPSRTESQTTQHASPPAQPPGSATHSTRFDATILFVDHQMLELAEFRRLAMSHPCQLDFALSGTEVLRRLSSASPPDVVVMGRLVGSPDCDEVLHKAQELGARRRTSFILVRERVEAVGPSARGATVLRKPLTESSLHNAIRQSLSRAS